ncbi:MAG: FAD-dependent oxidoreductase [Chryseolinea sp.]
MSNKFIDEHFIDADKFSRFPKPIISQDLLIKETVGLRPFRKNGFRIEKEQFGSKTIIHNYGHGGSGWSLSWGCAQLVLPLVQSTNEREIGVIGSGISGLSTARTLQDSGYKVTIYTKALPPYVTSSKATGTWSPSFTLIEEELITPEFQEKWRTAARYSFKHYQNLLGLNDIVTWMDVYVLIENPGGGHATGHGPAALDIPGMLPKATILEKGQHPFHTDQVAREKSMVFNIPSYLNKLVSDFLAFGGKIAIKEFHNPDDIGALAEKCIVNCTGLGAKALFNDDNLIPVAGQLSFLIPQPSFNYRITTEKGYIIPRKDGVILGGNMLKGVWDETPNPAQTLKVINALRETVSKMRS